MVRSDTGGSRFESGHPQFKNNNVLPNAMKQALGSELGLMEQWNRAIEYCFIKKVTLTIRQIKKEICINFMVKEKRSRDKRMSG